MSAYNAANSISYLPTPQQEQLLACLVAAIVSAVLVQLSAPAAHQVTIWSTTLVSLLPAFPTV